MTPEQFERVKELFDRAKSLSADERSALFAAERPDPEVHAKLLGMFDQHDETAALKLFDGTTETQDRADMEVIGKLIGPYKLLERIGEGAFGDVYRAQQGEPVRRLVAVKILKPGMDSRTVVARFEQERQALAMMDHPNIAKVFDAGTTPNGRPYFVMELVRGQPITKYCDQNHLTIVERLELFSQVCHAVQHAHQKAVIHRDLKPSNVLVSTVDDRPHAVQLRPCIELAHGSLQPWFFVSRQSFGQRHGPRGHCGRRGVVQTHINGCHEFAVRQPHGHLSDRLVHRRYISAVRSEGIGQNAAVRDVHTAPKPLNRRKAIVVVAGELHNWIAHCLCTLAEW